MKKAILILALLLGAMGLAGQTVASDGPTMHNCPQDGKWAISVWTGDTTDAGEALATCNIQAAYALTPSGAWQRYIPGAPDVNNMGPLGKYDGVIALGGPAVPVAEPETNVSIFGELDGCTINDLALSARAAGDSTYYARSGLHMEPPPIIEGTLATWTVQQMAPLVEVCLYCDGLLQCADTPEASGDAHIYTIEVLVNGDQYEILPRGHEYMQFYVGRDAEGNYRYARLGEGGKIPFNPTCPNNAWKWDDDKGFWCEGYPDAVWKARLCNPGESPVPGETYCLWHE